MTDLHHAYVLESWISVITFPDNFSHLSSLITSLRQGVALIGLGLATKTWLALNSQKAVWKACYSFVTGCLSFPRLLPFLSAVVFRSLVFPSFRKNKCSSALSQVSNTELFLIKKGKKCYKKERWWVERRSWWGKNRGGGFRAPTRRLTTSWGARYVHGAQTYVPAKHSCIKIKQIYRSYV